MDFNLEVLFKNMPEMKSIRRHLEKEVEQIDQKFKEIKSCHVNFGRPYPHRYPGNIYEFKIEVDLPENKTIKVKRSPSADDACLNVFTLIQEAFKEVEDKLETCASKSCASRRKI